MINITIEKKIKGEWITKRRFLESCEVQNLPLLIGYGRNCIRFICPYCQKENLKGKFYHPLDIWEHLDHHPEVAVRISWNVKDRREFDLTEETPEIKEERLLDFKDWKI